MPRQPPSAAILSLLLATLVLAPRMVLAQGRVSVVTHDGRSHHGVVDSRTDQAALWLRHDEPTAALAFEVAWDKIAVVAVDGLEIPQADWQTQLGQIVEHRPALSVLLGPVERTPDPVASSPSRATARQPRIAAIALIAHLANWDSDAQADGIEVIVAAFDRTGQAWPVRGDLTVRLLGQRQTRSYRSTFGELQRWTEPVKAAHFGDPRFEDATTTARYRLPFRALEPEADLRIAPEAVVHASLGVAGQGRFEATASLLVRKYNPLRERLQQRTGRRHFQVERARPPSIPTRHNQPVGRSSF